MCETLVIRTVETQSGGDRFSGDVFLDIFNKISRNEDNFLDQIYVSKYVRINIIKVLILYNIIRKCILKLQLSMLKPNFMSFPNFTVDSADSSDT